MTQLLSNTRDRSGLFITIALHAGVAAIGLLAVTTTSVTRMPPPISTRPIPDTPKPVPDAVAPVIHDLAIPIDVPLPEPIIDTAPDSDTRPLITAPEPPVRPADPKPGTGIAADTLPKIFDPYFSTKQRGSQKGMGLGLTISHSIIQQHGGTLTAFRDAQGNLYIGDGGGRFQKFVFKGLSK
jgi:hypothetical protein